MLEKILWDDSKKVFARKSGAIISPTPIGNPLIISYEEKDYVSNLELERYIIEYATTESLKEVNAYSLQEWELDGWNIYAIQLHNIKVVIVST